MPDHTITLGNVELVSLSDGFPLRLPLIPFPDTKIEQWREFPGLLDSNDQDLRAASIEALGRIGLESTELIQKVKTLSLRDQYDFVRAASRAALREKMEER